MKTRVIGQKQKAAQKVEIYNGVAENAMVEALLKNPDAILNVIGTDDFVGPAE